LETLSVSSCGPCSENVTTEGHLPDSLILGFHKTPQDCFGFPFSLLASQALGMSCNQVFLARVEQNKGSKRHGFSIFRILSHQRGRWLHRPLSSAPAHSSRLSKNSGARNSTGCASRGSFSQRSSLPEKA